MIASSAFYRQVESYLHYCQFTRDMSAMTLASKRHIYLHFITDSGCTNIRRLTNRHYDLWVAKQIESGVSNRTINMRTAHIKALVKYFQAMGVRVPIKLPLLKQRHEGEITRTFYTKAEITKVLSNADEMTELLIRICFDAGLRISELRNLRLSNIHGQKITFIGKGNKNRETYITTKTYKLLTKYIMSHHIKNSLWPSRHGKSLAVDTLRKKMRRSFVLAGFEDFHPHALRHSFATDLQNRGAELLEMQIMLGHANAQTTERYLHGLEGQCRALFAKYKDRSLKDPM